MEEFSYEDLEKKVDQVNSTSTTEVKTQSNEKKQGFQKKDNFNGWTDISISEVNPVELPLNNVNKVYSIYSDYKSMTSEVMVKFIKLITLLAKVGYTCRIGYPSDAPIATTLGTMEGLSFEYYLPFKKYNEQTYCVGSVPNDKLPFQISKYVNKTGYEKIPGIVRAFRANAVQLVLGRTCLLPTNFVIIYTKCGTTEITAKTDFKKCDFPGSTQLVIKLANMLKVPVINLGDDNWYNKFKTLVSVGDASVQITPEEPHKVEVTSEVKVVEETVPVNGDPVEVKEEVTIQPTNVDGVDLPKTDVIVTNEVNLDEFV